MHTDRQLLFEQDEQDSGYRRLCSDFLPWLNETELLEGLGRSTQLPAKIPHVRKLPDGRGSLLEKSKLKMREISVEQRRSDSGTNTSTEHFQYTGNAGRSANNKQLGATRQPERQPSSTKWQVFSDRSIAETQVFSCELCSIIVLEEEAMANHKKSKFHQTRLLSHCTFWEDSKLNNDRDSDNSDSVDCEEMGTHPVNKKKKLSWSSEITKKKNHCGQSCSDGYNSC